MGVIMVMAMAVAAVVSEHAQGQAALRKAHDDLDLRVKERTAELAEANRALQTGRAKLAEAQQIAQVGSWEWDITRDLLGWSDELYRIYGLKPREISLTFEKFLEYVHPEDRSFVREKVQTACRDHKPFSFHHRIVRRPQIEAPRFDLDQAEEQPRRARVPLETDHR